MTPASPTPSASRGGLFVEFGLSILIIVALCGVASVFVSGGYLPPPFFHNTDDTFMDWYNTAYWAHNPGAYEEWLTVYPPLSFEFLKLFSISSCYEFAGNFVRHCDPVGYYAISAFLILNAILTYFIFRHSDSRTVWPRTLAMALGMPMLYAWERGNLIIPCFTFFLLGHGRLLRSAWLKWLCVAVTVNFKPYLVVVLLGRIIRRQWRWAEGCGLACLLLYLVSYILLGEGNPQEFLYDIKLFSEHTVVMSLDAAMYSSSYKAILEFLRTTFPIMKFIGSRPMEIMEWLLPLTMRLGEIGVAACFAGALWRPAVLSTQRLAALSMALVLTITNPGGYAEVFLVFFVFFEPWRGAGRCLALAAAYLLCVPWDFQLVKIAHEVEDSYLSGRTVGHDLAVTFGQVLRPGLVLLIEYGLVIASIGDLWRSAAARQSVFPSTGDAPGAPALVG
jgi:hypothetical protein